MESINEALCNAAVILFSCDKNGKIILHEGGGLKRHGILPGEYVGSNAFDTFKDLPGFLDALNIALKGDFVQTVYKWGNDYCETHLTPQLNGGVVGVCTTQTVRILKEREHELEKAIKVKEESKKDFLAIISHELRTPLSGLIGIISLIKDSSIETYYLDIMSKTANKLLSLVNELLDYSKIEKDKMVIECIPYNIYNLIKDIKNLFNTNAAGKNLEFILEIDCLKNIEALGDQNRISQILNNFVSNSIKFTEKGTITIGVKTINESLIYYVKDTGIGIKEDEKINIFKDYSQANEKIFENFGGTGLGLYISKKLAIAMNGTVGFMSNKYETEFWLQVPFNKNLEKSTILTPIIFDSNFHSLDTKILIAEDSSTMQFIFQKYLHKLGYTNITLCNNGEIAWETIYNCSNSNSDENSFDFVFLDNYMPKLSGTQVANNIINLCEIKPTIIWMSAEDVSDELIRNKGFDFSIKKPFDILEIKNILEMKKILIK